MSFLPIAETSHLSGMEQQNRGSMNLAFAALGASVAGKSALRPQSSRPATLQFHALIGTFAKQTTSCGIKGTAEVK